MTFQGYRQGVLHRRRKVVLKELTELEKTLGLKNKWKACQFVCSIPASATG